MVRSFQVAGFFVLLALIGLILAVLAALYLPENWTLNSPSEGALHNWRLEPEDIPPSLLYIRGVRTTNRGVADDYPDVNQMLILLQSWGRKEGFQWYYRSREVCTDTGPRDLVTWLVLHEDAEGARGYHEWSRARDVSKGYVVEDFPVGQSGYIFWSQEPSTCDPQQIEDRIEISFLRDHLRGGVTLDIPAGWKDSAKQDALETLTTLARRLDMLIQQESAGK